MKTGTTFWTWMPLLMLGVAGNTSCKKPQPTAPPPTVQSSEWISPHAGTALQWTKQELPGIGKALVLDIPDDAITTETINNSVILVYARLNGYSPGIWPTNKVGLMRLILTYKIGVNSRTDVWSATATPGKMSILLTNADNEYEPWAGSDLHSFRYILVPKYDPSGTGKKPVNGASTILSRYSESDLRTMTYEQFCNIAGLKK